MFDRVVSGRIDGFKGVAVVENHFFDIFDLFDQLFFVVIFIKGTLLRDFYILLTTVAKQFRLGSGSIEKIEVFPACQCSTAVDFIHQQILNFIYIKSNQILMTLYYVYNRCALAVNNAWYNTYLEGNRKALITELFFIFLLYFITQVLHAFRYKNNQANPNSVRQSLMAVRISQVRATQGEEKEDMRPELPWHEKRWNRTFAFIFSSHAVALGMVLLFSPLTGAIVVAYIHLLFFIIYFVLDLKLILTGAKIMRVLMDIMNITLMIIGTTGINYNQSYEYFVNGVSTYPCIWTENFV